jgi:TRAP-type C4-dicarboxylate transport system permease small subunit
MWDKMIEKFFSIFFNVICILMILTVVYQIASRPLGIVNSWTEELSRWLFVWACFLGSAYYVKIKGHIVVDLINEVPFLRNISRKCSPLLNAIILLFYIFMTYAAFEFVQYFGGRYSSGIRVPERFLYVSLFVSFLLMSIFQFLNMIADFRQEKRIT